MKIQAKSIVLRLRKRQHITLQNARGVTVRCLSGAGLWVTQDGDGKDYALASGETMTFTTKRGGYIQLLDDADLALSSPRRLNRAPSCQILPPTLQ